MSPTSSVYDLCINWQAAVTLKRQGMHELADVLTRSPAQLVALLGDRDAARVEAQIKEWR